MDDKLTIVLSTVCIFHVAALAAHDQITLSRLIFHDRGGCLDPEITLELLREYKCFDPRMSNYINLSEDHEKKCDFKSTLQILSLLSNQPEESKTIRAYEEYHWNMRILFCKDNWIKELEVDVGNLTIDEMRLSDSLKNSIKKSIPGFNYKELHNIQDSRQFLEGILFYFEENLGLNSKQVFQGANCRHLFKPEFDRLLGLSEQVQNKLRRSSRLYGLLANHPETNLDCEQFVLNWLENLKICQLIVNSWRETSTALKRLIKSKYHGLSFGRKFLDCFGVN